MIDSIEYYLPEKIITNDDLKKEFPNWESDKVEFKIGISQRHVVIENETALDLGEKVANMALKNFEKNKIDFLLFCTQSPDYFLPSSACILQDRLGLDTSVGALDFNLGCSGYIYGLSLAKGLIVSGTASNVLLVVAETYSKHIYKKDVANRSIFGDAAAATIITENDVKNIGCFSLGTDGSGYDNLIVNNGATKNKIDRNAKEIAYGNSNYYTENNLYMNGPEIFNFTIEKVPQVVNDVLEKNSMTKDDIDYFIFHQANKYILNYLRKKIKIPEDKFYINLENTGNTVSATIPIALKNCKNQEFIKKEDKIMLVGFGVGYSWGATILTV